MRGWRLVDVVGGRCVTETTNAIGIKAYIDKKINRPGCFGRARSVAGIRLGAWSLGVAARRFGDMLSVLKRTHVSERPRRRCGQNKIYELDPVDPKPGRRGLVSSTDTSRSGHRVSRQIDQSLEMAAGIVVA